MAKQKYYSMKKTVDKYPECMYYVVFGERSNGKSYSTLELFVEDFYKSGFTRAFGYIRRWSEDVRSSNMEQVFKSLLCNDNAENRIAEITKNEYNTVIYKSRLFFLAYKNEETGEIEKQVDEPMGYVFSLAESERIKSTGYPTIKWILLEEFISEGLPMVNEFTRFTSVISTIIRNRDDTKIIMLGNTINKYNLYFNELGLYKAKSQLKNTVDVYEYTADDGRILKIACEYADFPDRKVKKSNIYFAFNNSKNAMITNGSWQIASYPHLEFFYTPADIKLIYFIEFSNELFQCEIIKVKDTKDTRIINDTDSIYSHKSVVFTYIHRKTSDIKYPYKHIIFRQGFDTHNNIRRRINNTFDDIGKFIFSFFTTENVTYQDNSVGDAINGYLNWCYTK